MIISDQPTCFPDNVLVAMSSKTDGTMLDRVMGVHDDTIVSNRTKFCDSIGIGYGDAVYQRIVYGDDRTYDLIAEVDAGSTTKNTSEVVADALFTRATGVAMMLPVADCIATVIYDPKQQAMALLHLGRHSTLTPLLARVIDKFVHEGSRQEDLIVWMSPNAHASDYVLEYFDHENDSDWQDFYYKSDKGYHLDMQGFNRAVCLKKGVADQNIYTSTISTVTDENYFSHYSGDKAGRFAVVAMLR